MEERVPSPDDPPQTPSSAPKPPLPGDTVASHGGESDGIHEEEEQQQQLPLPPRLATYVVQIPKDQIYRVPPPENARIVESYQKPEEKKKRGGHMLCLFGAIALLLIGFIIGMSFLIIHLVYSPKAPVFSVTSIKIKMNNPSPKQKHAEIDVNLLSNNNPNGRMGLDYKTGGDASLSYKNRVIAKGKYPSISQKPKSSSAARLILKSTNVPAEIVKSVTNMKAGKGSTFWFGFTAMVPAKFTSSMRSVEKEVTVNCDIKVNIMRGNTKILRQQCNSEI